MKIPRFATLDAALVHISDLEEIDAAMRDRSQRLERRLDGAVAAIRGVLVGIEPFDETLREVLHLNYSCQEGCKVCADFGALLQALTNARAVLAAVEGGA